MQVLKPSGGTGFGHGGSEGAGVSSMLPLASLPSHRRTGGRDPAVFGAEAPARSGPICCVVHAGPSAECYSPSGGGIGGDFEEEELEMERAIRIIDKTTSELSN